MPEFFNFRKPKIYYKFWSSLHQLHNLVTYSHMILTCSISLILIFFCHPKPSPEKSPGEVARRRSNVTSQDLTRDATG